MAKTKTPRGATRSGETIPPEVHPDIGAEAAAPVTAEAPEVPSEPAVPQVEDTGPWTAPASDAVLAHVPDTPPAASPDIAAEARRLEDEPADTRPVDPAPPASRPASAPRRGGFFPLLLGGLLAGALGFAAARYADDLIPLPPREDAAAAARDDRLATLERDVAALAEAMTAAPEAADPAPLAALEAALAEQAQRLDALSAQIEEGLAAAPVLSDGEPAPDLDTYRAELDTIRAEMQAEIDALRGETDARLAEAREAAQTIEEDAEAATRATAGRAALARLLAALETGAPMTDPLRDLEDALGDRPPAPLLAVETGAPTLAELQASFPDAARRALTEARRAGVSGEATGPVGAFLRNQFAVRSVAPRDGTDANAILSRAEAAVAAGRLSDALAEIEALPEPARAPLDDWIAAARARAEALRAADDLATTFNEN